MGENFRSTKQYSVWGWFKPTSSNPAIQNILTIQNVTGSESFKKNAFAGNFPECPYTEQELLDDEDLLLVTEVLENPRCDWANVNNGAKEDLLYVNYDLEPAVDGTQKYSLVFIIQKGRGEQQSEMTIEGFTGLQRTDAWSFFGISLDYLNGTATIYLKVFDAEQSAPLQKSFSVQFADFQLKQDSVLVVAGVE